MARPVATYSIVACDLERGQWGVATQSKFLAVGSVVPWAEPQAGAVATQSYANPRYGPDGLALLRQGLAAEEVVRRLTEADDGRDERQLGVVDAQGAARRSPAPRATTGPAAEPGPATPRRETSSSPARPSTRWRRPSRLAGALAERLLEALAAAQAAGGDKRGQQSAALIVVERDGGYAGLSDTLVDLRVDDHEAPIEELRRLYGLHQQLFGTTPRAEWLPVDDELRLEIEGHLARLGYERLEDWAGAANLEERIDGDGEIDPVVLNELRRRR